MAEVADGSLCKPTGETRIGRPDMDQDHDPMWFFDDQSEDYRNFRKEALALEREYLELRQLLVAAADHLRAEPDNEHFQAKVKYLTKRTKDLEEKAPWLTSGLMLEYGLWGVPH